ncbi:MAG: hypothetical protein LBT40_02170 [Deltaproteobacteria bacterium]|jgi:hypothetical protein|nr:hypothetical protein [Deltaproteobacteria bacterium]
MTTYFADRRVRGIPGLQSLNDPSRVKIRAAYEARIYCTFELFILPLLPELALLVASRYCQDNGRPTTDLETLTGLYILMVMMDWTVETALERIQEPSGRIHRALGLPENPTDADIMFSVRTFYQFMKNFQEVDGPSQAFLKITLFILKKFNVDVRIVRMDSTDVESNIRDLRRHQLIRVTVQLFMREFGRAYPSWLGELDRGLRGRFDDSRKIGYDPLGQMDKEKRTVATEQMPRDAVSLVRRFRHDPNFWGMDSFRSLARLVREQCEVVPGADGGEPAVRLKEPGDVGSNSLQSPHDTGVTYNGHKKKSCRKLQAVENCSRTRKSSLEMPFLSILLNVKTTGGHESDVHAVADVVAFLKEMNLPVELFLVDNIYNTVANRELVKKEIDAKMITTVYGGLTDPSGNAGEQGT